MRVRGGGGGGGGCKGFGVIACKPLRKVVELSKQRLVIRSWYNTILTNEPFSTAERSERVENFLFRTTRNTRKQASSKRLLPGDALAPTAQNRASTRCVNDTSAHRRPQLYNRTFPTSRAHRGSLSKRRELVLSSLPTRPPLFSPSLGPQSLTLRVSFPCICSPPVCIICSVTSLSLATTTWTPEHPFFSTHCYPNASSDITCVLGGGSFPVTSHGFSSKGVAAVKARRLFPSTISGVRAQFPSYLWVEN